MRIELGRLSNGLPRFLFSVRRPRRGAQPVTIIGRLYRGYVGLLVTRPGRVNLTLWIHSTK